MKGKLTIEGNRQTFLKKTGLIQSSLFSGSFNSIDRSTIYFDSQRTIFFPTNQKTHKDFLRAWIKLDAGRDYLQGIMTASYGKHLLIYFREEGLHVPKIKEFLDGLRKREINLFEKNQIQLMGLSYFDDEGNLCGACIVTLRDSPDLWMVCFNRNPQFAEKEVLFALVPDEFPLPSLDEMPVRADLETFFKKLNSEEVAESLRPLFKEDHTIDLQALAEMKESYQKNITEEVRSNFAEIEPLHNLLVRHSELVLQNETLLNHLQHSFLKRHVGKLGLLSLIGLGFIALGVLVSPVGLVITVPLLIGVGVAAITLVMIGLGVLVKLIRDEQHLKTQISDREINNIRMEISQLEEEMEAFKFVKEDDVDIVEDERRDLNEPELPKNVSKLSFLNENVSKLSFLNEKEKPSQPELCFKK